MVSISGSKKLKRQMAPVFWGLGRKSKRFVVAPRPGPHPKKSSVPAAVLLRDMLGVAYSLREAKAIIYGGDLVVDGKVRKSIHFGVGLMDAISLRNNTYRMVPSEGKLLRPVSIPADEAAKKLVKITSKVTIKGGKTALGCHDGRTIISDVSVKVGDSCLLEVPSQKILDVMPIKTGSSVMVIKGVNAGQSGIVERVEEGTFILPPRAAVTLKDRSIEIPIEAVMATGGIQVGPQ